MVRETRYLWVGNLPESASEDQILEQLNRQDIKFVRFRFLYDQHGRRAPLPILFLSILKVRWRSRCGIYISFLSYLKEYLPFYCRISLDEHKRPDDICLKC